MLLGALVNFLGSTNWERFAFAPPALVLGVHAVFVARSESTPTPARGLRVRAAGTEHLVESDLLPIYLRDHFAASHGAIRRCRSAHERDPGSEVGAFFERLAREIEEDQATLRDVLRRLGVEPSRAKIAGALVGERLGRLKPNGRLLRPSPLGRVYDLEVLTMGVDGKRALWASLGDLRDPRLDGLDFDGLAARAQRQHDELEEHRRAAARAAFGAAA